MNNLSWLIYWADTLPHLANLICGLSVIVCVLSAIIFFIGLTGCFGGESIYHANLGRSHLYKTEADLAPRFRKVWPITIVACLFWTASFLVPEKETFYLIAASQAGEKAAETPEFAKVRSVINKWLDDNADTKSSNAAEVIKPEGK